MRLDKLVTYLSSWSPDRAPVYTRRYAGLKRFILTESGKTCRRNCALTEIPTTTVRPQLPLSGKTTREKTKVNRCSQRLEGEPEPHYNSVHLTLIPEHVRLIKSRGQSFPFSGELVYFAAELPCRPQLSVKCGLP